MEQRSKRKGGKSRTVALKAEEESPKAATSRKDKGKALFTKSDTESSSSESDDDSDSESLPETDADEEMMKLCALMKNFRRFEGRGGKSDRGNYTNVKCYNCGEKGHISPDCKKVKGDKGKALVTKQKSWIDTSDTESEENYALMANADEESAESSSETAETKLVNFGKPLVFAEFTDYHSLSSLAFDLGAAGTPNMKICVVGAGTTSIFDNVAHSSKQILDIAFAPSKAIGKVLALELPHTGNRKCTVLYPASVKASSEIGKTCIEVIRQKFDLLLYEPMLAQVLLLDEVTLDLDVVARMDLLDFFKTECE
ncbi:hypothetical protein AgCh_032038 [Apium graveolens]